MIPQDLNCEKIVLGTMLAQPAFIADVKRVLKPADFFDLEHQALCKSIFSVPVQEFMALAVHNDLKAKGLFASVGEGATEQTGAQYIVSLVDDYCHFRKVLTYEVSRIRHASMLRQAASLCMSWSTNLQTSDLDDAPNLIAELQKDTLTLGTGDLEANTLCTAHEAATDAVEHSEAVKAGTKSLGLNTGFLALDRCVSIQPGDLITLSAATGGGKTSFAITISANVAEVGGKVLYVSAEMGRQAMGFRFLQLRSGVDSSRLRSANLDEWEYDARNQAMKQIETWRYSVLTGTPTVRDIALRVKQQTVKWGTPPDLIVADYLGLIRPESGKSRQEQVSAIAWGLKLLAMDTQCPVLMLCQLNREGVKLGNPPNLHDLRESGDIENHSNAVLLMHIPKPLQQDHDGAWIVWLQVAKCRDGITTGWPDKDENGIKLRFKPNVTTFEPMSL